MSEISRRYFLRLTGFSAAFLALTPAFAATGTNTAFSAIIVDASPMRERGDGIRAGWVEQDLTSALKTRFSSGMNRNAPRLIVRIDSLSLSSFGGGADHSSDFLKGTALVVGRNGESIASYPILLALSPASTGVWYSADIDRRRITSLCDTFADWVKKYIG